MASSTLSTLRRAGAEKNLWQRRPQLEYLESRIVLAASPRLDAWTPIGADEYGQSAAFAENEASSVYGESPSASKRYAILGDNLDFAEAELMRMGITKIKKFKHLSGVAVKLSDSQAESLRSILGSGFRISRDQPFKAFDDVRVAKKGGGGGPGDGGQQVPWGINAVNALVAWSVTRGAGVAVCVVDSGIDSDHPDLATIAAGENYIDGGS